MGSDQPDTTRAPSTLGTFLRSFTFGHVRQLDAVAARLLTGLASRAPLLPGAATLAYVDVDDTVRGTYGYAKQGADRGYTGVNGLNALLGVVSTPGSAPVICATRLRKGSAASARGAARLVTDALVTARAVGATGLRVLRADSAYYGYDVIAAARRQRARFSVTARLDPAVRAAIATLTVDPATVWTPIRHPQAVWDETGQCWVSDAEVAETTYTAFRSRPKAQQVTARLLIRRVPDRNPAHQTELFTVYRYHAVFTDSPLPLVAAEAAHRAHAIIEQVIADLKGGPLAHLPSGKFAANSAWLVCAAIAFNLTRAAGTLASACHARATTATLRAQHRRPSPPGPLRPHQHPAPATVLALGSPLAADDPSSQTRTAPTRHTLTSWPHRPDQDTEVDAPAAAGRPPTTPTPPHNQPQRHHQRRRSAVDPMLLLSSGGGCG